MAETESTRMEIGFNGGQIMSAIVTAKSADALELAVSGGSGETLNLDAEDGRYTDRKSTRLNSSHIQKSRMPSSA